MFFIKKIVISALMIVCAVNVPVHGIMQEISIDNSSSSSSLFSGLFSGFSWGKVTAASGVALLVSTLYFKGYQRWNYGNTLNAIQKEFIEPAKDDKSPLFMHWRFSDFAGGSANFWGSAGQLSTANKQNFKKLLLEELHFRRITNDAGVLLKKGDKPDGFPLDAHAPDQDRKDLLLHVLTSIDYELGMLKKAMEKLAPMDSLLSPGLGVDPIDQVWSVLSKEHANICGKSFDWKKPESWNFQQEQLINETMKTKSQEQPSWLESLSSKFGYLWYNDPYHKAREYYWTLYKFESRLKQMKKIVQDIIDEGRPPQQDALAAPSSSSSARGSSVSASASPSAPADAPSSSAALPVVPSGSGSTVPTTMNFTIQLTSGRNNTASAGRNGARNSNSDEEQPLRDLTGQSTNSSLDKDKQKDMEHLDNKHSASAPRVTRSRKPKPRVQSAVPNNQAPQNKSNATATQTVATSPASAAASAAPAISSSRASFNARMAQIPATTPRES